MKVKVAIDMNDTFIWMDSALYDSIYKASVETIVETWALQSGVFKGFKLGMCF